MFWQVAYIGQISCSFHVSIWDDLKSSTRSDQNKMEASTLQTNTF